MVRQRSYVLNLGWKFNSIYLGNGEAIEKLPL